MLNNLISLGGMRATAVAGAMTIGILAAQSDTVYFGESTQGPAQNLSVGDVYISGASSWNPAGEVANVSGVGLGATSIGSAGSVDRIVEFGSPFSVELDLQEGLTLSVPGRINSITLAPHFSWVGSSTSVELPFQVMLVPLAYASNAVNPGPLQPDWLWMNPTYPASTSYTGIFASGEYSSFSISLASSGSGAEPGSLFYSYLESQGFPEATFEFGVTIQAIDFTPLTMAVPEPTVFSLLAMGAVGSLLARRPPAAQGKR
jgi:hypothetical protein